MDEIKISGGDSNIEISGGEDISIKGKEDKINVDAGKRDIEIKGDDNKVKIIKEKGINFFKNKRNQKILIFSLLVIIIIFGFWIRIQNIPLLIDSTTGEKIPLALDPYYFLRVAETIVEGGGLPEFDSMRYPSLHLPFQDQFTSHSIILFYKIGEIFNKNLTLNQADIISPVILFILGMILFFFLIKKLTKSNSIALLSSAFLALIPSYLYRTMAGFADHEAIGMVGFFLTLLIGSSALIKLNKKIDLKKISLYGGLLGLASAFTILAWSGVANFIFMIIPLAFFIFWLLKSQNKEKSVLKNTLTFYLIWIISLFIFGGIFGASLLGILNKYLISSQGILSVFVLGFMSLDYFLMKKSKIKKNRQGYVFGILIGLGILLMIIKGNNVFSVLGSVWNKLISPFGEGRVGSTVAENAQPYLKNWINEMGKSFFWMFIAGITYLGFEISKGIKKVKEKRYFIFFWILMIFGIIFSKTSASSILNGDNFISQAVYFIPLFLFLGYSIKLYYNKQLEIKSELIFIASWMFFMIIFARSAVRFFFLITPFVCFSASFFVIKTFEYFRKNKDELLKIVLGIILILGIIGAGWNLFVFAGSSISQSKQTGPSANYQWQNAMSWVRENTPEDSIFVHWWDYGYWVQYLGERATITDGGHANGFWDHLIGRYVLTTPNPASALSFMKAHKVSYLLIDQTDLGKYAAYSKIGSDGEHNNYDRFASFGTLISEKSQIQETSEGMIRLYQGGIGVDEDIVYEYEGKKTFIPGPIYDNEGNPNYKAYLGGVSIEISNSNEIESAKAIYIYNNQQIMVPLKYVYIGDELVDLGGGLDAVFRLYPRFYSANGQYQIDSVGAGIYLSPKVSKSLFAQLYLMDDPLNKYSSLELAHSEPNYMVKDLKNQGALVDEFIYYQGFRGPIKIWKVNENPNIIAREEFLQASGNYAEFDDLEFKK